MDDQVKAQLIAGTVQAIGVPLLRAGVNNHYRMKQIEREEEMQLKIAERQQKGAQALARAKGGGDVRTVETVEMESPGDVYDELEALRQETNCSFCHGVIDSLMDAPPAEAKSGYEELRSYVREVERIKERDMSEEEAEQVVGELVDQWETVPRYAAGMA